MKKLEVRIPEWVKKLLEKIEERTPISLKGDIASRVRSGDVIELSDLANL